MFSEIDFKETGFYIACRCTSDDKVQWVYRDRKSRDRKYHFTLNREGATAFHSLGEALRVARVAACVVVYVRRAIGGEFRIIKVERPGCVERVVYPLSPLEQLAAVVDHV